MKSVFLSEPRKPGDEIRWFNQRYRIVAEIPRAEAVQDIEERRELDRRRGLPPARCGTYTAETSEFAPSRDIPPESQFPFAYAIELID